MFWLQNYFTDFDKTGYEYFATGGYLKSQYLILYNQKQQHCRCINL